MEAPTILPPETDPLDAFCRKFLSENEANWPPEEESLAEAFATHFHLPPIFDLNGFIEFCKPLGIEVSIRSIPYELRGYNSVYENRRLIIVSDRQDFPSADLHTAFHELREIIEYYFRGLSKPTAIGADLESRAEQFATFLRVQRTMQMAGILADDARKIDHPWKRRGAYVLIILATTLYGWIDLSISHFERVSRDENRKT